MSAPIYLFRKPSSRTYFFRCSIPLDLRNHFDGRQEFRVSLASKSKIRSQRAACCLYSIPANLCINADRSIQILTRDQLIWLKSETLLAFDYLLIDF
ncbi:MAG: DUF6538 domain-containing protein [bacterium]